MSTFTWIDHSEKQRRQILEAIDLFREKDTRDELGIAGIRDAFSDMLFPGTGALQTRARYFFFVPWMYLDFEATRVPSAEVARKGRAFEIALIDRLADSSDSCGNHRHSGPFVAAAHSLEHLLERPEAARHLPVPRLAGGIPPQSGPASGCSARRSGETTTARSSEAWRGPGTRVCPTAPSTFPSKATFALTDPEARYLKGRVLENHRQSLFAFMLDRDYEDADADFAWEHPASQHAPVGPAPRDRACALLLRGDARRSDSLQPVSGRARSAAGRGDRGLRRHACRSGWS